MLQHPQWFRLWSRSGQLELFVPYLKLAVATQMSLKTWEVVCVVPFIDSMEWIICSSYTWSVGSFFIEASPVEEHWSWDCEQFPGTANFRSYWMLGRWPLLHATAPTVRRLTFKGSSCMPPPQLPQPCILLLALGLWRVKIQILPTQVSTATWTDCLYLWGPGTKCRAMHKNLSQLFRF